MRKMLSPFTCICFALGFILCLQPVNAGAAEETPLVLYTSVTATTPQVPLWAAIKNGWPQGRKLDVRPWKNFDDLRGVLLAGKGDIWLGNLEGFAQAAQRGAPVTLLAVTGWKKFHFLTTDATIDDLDSLARTLAQKKMTLAVAPADSPAIAVLQEIGKRGGPSFAINTFASQQLALDLLRGGIAHALLPEPLVSTLLAKKPELRRIASLEDEFAVRLGGPARLPMIGIAVNSRLIDQNPALIRSLALAMQEQAARLSDNPQAALDVLPNEVRAQASEDILLASLAHDLILALPAWEVRPELEAFLRMVAPQAERNLPPHFIMEPHRVALPAGIPE